MVLLPTLHYISMPSTQNFRRLLVFCGFTVLSITIICILTFSEETVNALISLQPQYIVLIFLLWLFGIFSDSIGIKLFVDGTGEKLPLKEGFKFHFVRIFFNLLTPFTFGGQPIIVMLLSKLGIPSGKGSSIVITRLLALTLFSSCGGIIALIYFGDSINQNPSLSIAFYSSAVIFILLYCSTITGLLFPPLMITIIRGLSWLLHKLHIIKDVNEFMKKGYKQVYIARSSFIYYFRKHLKYLLGGIFCCGLFYLVQISMLFMIFKAIGVSFSFIHGFSACALLIFLMGFMPTPGASGIGDVLFIVIFANAVPTYLMGIAILLWRSFYQFLSAIVGAIYSSRLFTNLLIKKAK